MKKALIAVMILCMTVLLFPLNAMADDASLVGGTGITAYTIQNTQIVMEKEIIDITVKDGYSYVNCQFWFHNTGKKTSLLVGFPTENPDDYYSGDDPDDSDNDNAVDDSGSDNDNAVDDSGSDNDNAVDDSGSDDGTVADLLNNSSGDNTVVNLQDNGDDGTVADLLDNSSGGGTTDLQDGDDGYDGSHDELDTQLFGFRTYIDGRRAPVIIKEGLKAEGNNTDGLYYPEWYTWKMTFKTGQKIKVVNKYRVVNSSDADTESIGYILRSGSTWKGAIGSVLVRMRFEGYDMYGITFDDMAPTYVTKNGTVVWKAKNIEPQDDINANASSKEAEDTFDNGGVMDNPFDPGDAGYDAYDSMGTRLMNNFDAGHYNGVTWWGHRFVKTFGDKQSDELYYLLGISYYRKGKYQNALDSLNMVKDEDQYYYPDQAYYYLPCEYYKALVYKSMGKKDKYIDCLKTIASYDLSSGSDVMAIGYWPQLWAQSRLKDLNMAS